MKGFQFFDHVTTLDVKMTFCGDSCVYHRSTFTLLKVLDWNHKKQNYALVKSVNFIKAFTVLITVLWHLAAFECMTCNISQQVQFWQKLKMFFFQLLQGQKFSVTGQQVLMVYTPKQSIKGICQTQGRLILPRHREKISHTSPSIGTQYIQSLPVYPLRHTCLNLLCTVVFFFVFFDV